MPGELVTQGIAAIESGDQRKARQFFAQAVLKNPKDVCAWFWLSNVVEVENERDECLQRVLSLDPGNHIALKSLQDLSPPVFIDPSTYLPPSLTTQHQEVILHQGSPLLVIAGPGSGKLELVAWRAARLIRSGLVQPENILAVTFTEKAALSLKDHIQQKLPGINVELMQISTIDAFAASLLRSYPAYSVLPAGFQILDKISQFLFILSNHKVLGLDGIVKGHPADFFASVLRTFNLATEELVDPQKLEVWCQESGAGCSEKEAGLWKEREILAAAYHRYCLLLQELGLVDFAFLQRHAWELLRKSTAVLDGLRNQYQEILVDEYQDADAVQEAIIHLLAGDGCRLTAVGDEYQSFDPLRSATDQHIKTFPDRYPGARVIKVIHKIGSLASTDDYSLQSNALNPVRVSSETQPMRESGSHVLLIDGHGAGEEGAAAAHFLERLDDTAQFGLYRKVPVLLAGAKSYAGPEASEAQGGSAQVTGDSSLFGREEIAQLYDLFNFLGNAGEWRDKVLQPRLAGLSEATRQALEAYKGKLFDVTSEAGLRGIGVDNSADLARLLGLFELKRRIQAEEPRSALQIFSELLAITGGVARFELDGDEDALSNLSIFSRLVAAWDEHGATRNLSSFLEYLELLKAGGVDRVMLSVENAVDQSTRPRHDFYQLAYYLQCPLRYKFAVVYNLQVSWLDPVDFGADVRHCLEAIHQRALRGGFTTPEQVPALVKEYWRSSPHASPEEDESHYGAAVKQLRQYLQEHGMKLLQAARAESRFSFPCAEHILQGKVDLIRYAEDAQVEIVDFKTSAAFPEDMDQIDLQLGLYALGVEFSLHHAVARRVAHFLRDGQVITWDWKPERRRAVQTQLAGLLGRIEHHEFPPRRLYCPRCQEFNRLCPYAGAGTSEQRTGIEK